MIHNILRNTIFKKNLDLHINNLINNRLNSELEPIREKLLLQTKQIEWLNGIVEKKQFLIKSLSKNIKRK